MNKCIICDRDIPNPIFKLDGRQHGKSTLLLYYNMRQTCCSDECCTKLIKQIQEELYE